MTAGTVIPIFVAIGIVFIPIGIALLVTSSGVRLFSDIAADSVISLCDLVIVHLAHLFSQCFHASQ